MGFSIIYSLFFGFGLSLGAQIYQRMTHTHIIGIEDYTCMESHREDIWYRNTPSMYWGTFRPPGPDRLILGETFLLISMLWLCSIPHGSDVFAFLELEKYGAME